MKKSYLIATIVLALLLGQAAQAVENLEKSRALVVTPTEGGGVYVGWRLFKSDPPGVAFNLYRNSVKVNSSPITTGTNYYDIDVDLSRSNKYYVVPVVNGKEQLANGVKNSIEIQPVSNFIKLALADGSPVGAASASNTSIQLQDIGQGAKHVGVGDLDGDGDYDFVVKRGNGDKDPSQSGDPGETYKLEGYRNDGTFLWRVDLWWNIRAGVWYSPFVVFDFDGDGRAEVAAKRNDTSIDHTDADGRDLTGPEYLIIIDGQNGSIRAQTNWIARGNVSDWGDSYGNRCDRHLIAPAYLDGSGSKPSIIIFRGTYEKMVAEAWDFNGSSLSRRWTWNRTGGGGYHNVRIGDVDNDGRDEIINGSICIDDNGSTKWVTGQGHGDRCHMTDINPDRPGKEIWYVQEDGVNYGIHLVDASNGSTIWGYGPTHTDVGRGVAGDIDAGHYGCECWASQGDFYTCTGGNAGSFPASINFVIWWDGDSQRELMDGTSITKYGGGTLDTFTGTVGSRNCPMGYADITGDWREEVFHVSGNTLHIYSTTISTSISHSSWMQDRDYRTSVACETMGYMQATQPSVYWETGSTTTTTAATTSTTTTAASTTTTASTTTAATTTTTTTSGGSCDCGTCNWYGSNIPMCCQSCSGWGWQDGGCNRSCVCPGSCPGGSTTTAASTTTTAATTTTTAATTSTTSATTSTTTTAATTTTTAATTTTTAATTTTTAATTTTTAATTTTTAAAGCTCDSGCDGTAITPNFSQNGSGQYCWQATSGTYINSWNLAKLEVNNTDYTNLYVLTSSFPAKISGVWYIYYNSSVAWGHFELIN